MVWSNTFVNIMVEDRERKYRGIGNPQHFLRIKIILSKLIKEIEIVALEKQKHQKHELTPN